MMSPLENDDFSPFDGMSGTWQAWRYGFNFPISGTVNDMSDTLDRGSLGSWTHQMIAEAHHYRQSGFEPFGETCWNAMQLLPQSVISATANGLSETLDRWCGKRCTSRRTWFRGPAKKKKDGRRRGAMTDPAASSRLEELAGMQTFHSYRSSSSCSFPTTLEKRRTEPLVSAAASVELWFVDSATKKRRRRRATSFENGHFASSRRTGWSASLALLSQSVISGIANGRHALESAAPWVNDDSAAPCVKDRFSDIATDISATLDRSLGERCIIRLVW